MIDNQSLAVGIYQPDIIIRTAIIAGLNDLRANTYLLEYVFKSLIYDDLTNKEYGQKEVDKAINWFLKTNIPVTFNIRAGDIVFPCVSVALQESVEIENTLADIHYTPSEDTQTSWPALTPIFTPSYNRTTGQITIPQSIADNFVLADGQEIYTKTGRHYVLHDTKDRLTTFIDENLKVDFTDSVMKGAFPSQSTCLESSVSKDTYSIGCHVAGETVFLFYLYSIIKFVLLRYRKTYLEPRGLDRVFINAAPVMKNEVFENEMVFSRFINITGYARDVWPAYTGSKVTAVIGQTYTQIDPDLALDPDSDGLALIPIP